jgi:hypothetical protein
MRQIPIYRRVDRAYLYSPSNQQCAQLGPVFLWAGSFLAIVSLLSGTAFAAFVPASPEQRIGSLFFFGLIPAVGFHVGGHILSRALVLCSELCEMIAARCFRYLALNFAIWVSPLTDASLKCLMLLTRCLSSKLYGLGHTAYCSVHRLCWCARRVMVDFSCLLIRSAARFVIKMHASLRSQSDRSLTAASCITPVHSLAISKELSRPMLK